MKRICLFILVGVTLAACGPNPKRLFRLDDGHLARREVSTRRFDTTDERKVLVASAQTLQDMGYIIDESEVELGLIVARHRTELRAPGPDGTYPKFRTVTHCNPQGACTTHVVRDVFDIERIRSITLAVNRSPADEGTHVRIDISEHRLTNWDTTHGGRRIKDARVYQEFFNKLSQSLFLQEHKI